MGIARHEWAHRPFHGLVLFLFCVFLSSPIFLAFLHPLASFPLSFTLQLEQSFPWAPLRIELAIKNFPRELPTSLPLWSLNRCRDDQRTVNTENCVVPLFNQKTLCLCEKLRLGNTEECQQGTGLTGRAWKKAPTQLDVFVCIQKTGLETNGKTLAGPYRHLAGSQGGM